MTDREKLIKLAGHIVVPYFAEHIADLLIAHGVTFATDNHVGGNWIPVTERLPEEGEIVLVCGSRKGIYTAEFRRSGEYHWFHKLNSKYHHCDPTHWMPLPEPPKEGE